MHVWNGLRQFRAEADGFVATLGNYDGVHLGHRTILAAVTQASRRRNVPSLVITFEPHPLAIVAPDRAPRLLQTRGQKIETLDGCGIDHLLILPFDAQVAAQSPEDFVLRWLGRQLRFDAVFVGSNFHFGQGRAGTVDVLATIGKQAGFDVRGIDPVRVDDIVVSSTEIRRRVADGDVGIAARLLGRPYELTGRVVRGDGRGRTLDFPTANLLCDNEILPRAGVYVTEATVDATRVPSVTNIGSRPTFEGGDLRVESHLFDFDEEIYDRRLDVRFLARLRDEQRFDTPDELADQIARDRAAAESFFADPRLQLL